MTDPVMHIEDLFKHTRLVWKAQNPKRVCEKETHTSELYANPDNWIKGRYVALIHQETQTLLGTFQEWTHRSVEKCTRLVRAEHPAAVREVEYVSGSWYVGGDPETREVSQRWHTFHDTKVHLQLSAPLSVHAPDCSVRVYMSYGAIARVELIYDTTFSALDEDSSTLLNLPKGVCVSDLMDRDVKCALKSQLLTGE